MGGKITQGEINRILWEACDTFRGKIDSSIYKDYVLVMLFVKYLSDTYKERLQEITEKYKGDEVRIKRTLRRQRFIIPDFASISESIRGKKKESAPQTQIRRVVTQSD